MDTTSHVNTNFQFPFLVHVTDLLLYFARAPSINDETNPTVHKIIPATCNVNSWEVEMVLERPTLLNAQDTFLLPVHIFYSIYHFVVLGAQLPLRGVRVTGYYGRARM